MPVISVFLGIVIRIFHDDHAPPHFHASYGEYDAVVEINGGRILHGRLPLRVRHVVEEWRRKNVALIRMAWADAIAGRMPRRIKPLE